MKKLLRYFDMILSWLEKKRINMLNKEIEILKIKVKILEKRLEMKEFNRDFKKWLETKKMPKGIEDYIIKLMENHKVSPQDILDNWDKIPKAGKEDEA